MPYRRLLDIEFKEGENNTKFARIWMMANPFSSFIYENFKLASTVVCESNYYYYKTTDPEKAILEFAVEQKDATKIQVLCDGKVWVPHSLVLLGENYQPTIPLLKAVSACKRTVDCSHNIVLSLGNEQLGVNYECTFEPSQPDSNRYYKGQLGNQTIEVEVNAPLIAKLHDLLDGAPLDLSSMRIIYGGENVIAKQAILNLVESALTSSDIPSNEENYSLNPTTVDSPNNEEDDDDLYILNKEEEDGELYIRKVGGTRDEKPNFWSSPIEWFRSKTYFPNYLFQTPYFRPTAAYERTIEVRNRHNITLPADNNPNYRQYHNENKIHLPYFGWHMPGLWTLLSFVPFTPQQGQRIAFAKEILDYQEVIATNLRHKDTTHKNGEEIADIQRLHPWTTGIKYAVGGKSLRESKYYLPPPTALSQQRTLNVLYRLGIYSGLLLSAALVAATLVVLLASGVFGPAAAAFITGLGATALVNFLVTALPASVPVLVTMLAASAVTGILALQEVLSPGSLARVFAKTIGQLVKPHSLLTKNLGRERTPIITDKGLKARVASAFLRYLAQPLIAGIMFNLFLYSPLAAFLLSYQDRVGANDRELHELRKGNYNDKALKVLQGFIPTSDMGDYSLIRTLLNPFQLMQMTLTWLTLTAFMITDFIGGIGGPFRWVNNGIQAMAYTVYAGAFLVLEPFKQLTGAVIARPVDSMVDALWVKGYEFVNRPPRSTGSSFNETSGSSADFQTSSHNQGIIKNLKNLWITLKAKVGKGVPCNFVASPFEDNENQTQIASTENHTKSGKTKSIWAKINGGFVHNKEKLTTAFNKQKQNIRDAGGVLPWIKETISPQKSSKSMYV